MACWQDVIHFNLLRVMCGVTLVQIELREAIGQAVA